ncbi:hypothetical protein MA4S0116S_0534, partial [Mycobacteroides abscessus 4S-0116-S]
MRLGHRGRSKPAQTQSTRREHQQRNNPDVAAVLCGASVAHCHRPARPFHHPRLAPTPQTN